MIAKILFTTFTYSMSQSSQIDLNLLRVFKSAYEYESVTRAAEQLDLTQ